MMFFLDGDRVEVVFASGTVVRGTLTFVDGVGLGINITHAVRVVVFPVMADGPHRSPDSDDRIVSVRHLRDAETFTPGDRVVRPNGLTGVVVGADIARIWVKMDAYDIPTSFQPHALFHDYR